MSRRNMCKVLLCEFSLMNSSLSLDSLFGKGFLIISCITRRQLSLGHISRRSSHSKVITTSIYHAVGSVPSLGGSTGNISTSTSSPGVVMTGSVCNHLKRAQLRLVLPTVVVAGPSPPDKRKNR